MTPDGQPLPDFSIPHQEKIDWMVETAGWAIEPVPANTDVDPPVPGYAYTISFPETFGFPEVLVFGLTPVAARGLLGLVADCLRGGTEIPVGVEVVGLLDNGLRCIFASVDIDEWGELVTTAVSWHRGRPFDLVQLIWPDRTGTLPYEPGFDARVSHAQPVIARTAE